MNPTKDELQKIKFAATISGELDEYVYLREDKDGKYIEYAFQDGAPHDNRCLSWYDSYQENAYIRNNWVAGLSDKDKKACLDTIKKRRDSRVGQLFRLSSFTCGCEEHLEKRLKEIRKSWEEYYPDEPFVPEDHVCKVGSPANRCREVQCKHWTYKEPVKCACWVLSEPSVPKMVRVPIETAMKLYNNNTFNQEQ